MGIQWRIGYRPEYAPKVVFWVAYERGGRALHAPSTRAPPERLRGGTHGGGSFNITSACISLPQARHSGVPRGAVFLLPPLGSSRRGPAPPPKKYKIRRKLRLKSNTWQWQWLRICLNSLLIQGEKSFSLLEYFITQDVQGVLRNMTIARRLESRLWYMNLFVTFSLLSTLTCMILETIIT